MIQLLVVLSVLCTTLHAAFDCKDIKTRAQWEAERVTCKEYLKTAVEDVFIHHIPGAACSAADGCKKQLKDLQAYHMGDRQLKDIAYNFLIDKDRNVYEGRGWDVVGYHTKDYNDKSIAIAYIGTLEGTVPDGKLDAVLKTAIDELIACGVGENAISEVKYSVKAYLTPGKTFIPFPEDSALITDIGSLSKI